MQAIIQNNPTLSANSVAALVRVASNARPSAAAQVAGAAVGERPNDAGQITAAAVTGAPSNVNAIAAAAAGAIPATNPNRTALIGDVVANAKAAATKQGTAVNDAELTQAVATSTGLTPAQVAAAANESTGVVVTNESTGNTTVVVVNENDDTLNASAN